jgi:hypothetical protein
LIVLHGVPVLMDDDFGVLGAIGPARAKGHNSDAGDLEVGTEIRLRVGMGHPVLPSTLIRVPRVSNVHPRPGFFRPAPPTRPA